MQNETARKDIYTIILLLLTFWILAQGALHSKLQNMSNPKLHLL